ALPISGRELTPPIRILLTLHGIGMSAWMLLFLVQPLLIVAGNRRVHMLLGQFSAGLAAVIVVLGIDLGIESARVNPPDLRIWALSPKHFMAVPIISVGIFGLLVAIGVWKRRRPEVHRPMMLLAVLAVMPAALDRIDVIKALYNDTVWGTIFGPFFSTLVVGLFLLILKWLLTRSFDRWFAMGYAGLVVAGALIMRLAKTSAWDNFASFLLR
ncbi:MAG: hypothetical protein JWQ04_575, partial [Pedosphaera sp.]|nr:hypothetical protein [Pedosphaera sp.]